MSYRENADGMSLLDAVNSLESKLEKNIMNGQQQYNSRITRNIILGIIGSISVISTAAVGCNVNDNRTRSEIAKQCPAVSPIPAVGLTQQK